MQMRLPRLVQTISLIAFAVEMKAAEKTNGAVPDEAMQTRGMEIIGRLLDFDARYSHKFNVRVSSFVGVGATTLRILWRPFDSDR